MSTEHPTHYEASLERDLDQIRTKVQRMGKLCEAAMRRCVEALRNADRQLALSVIIRDQQIDLLEKEIDRLCLQFLVRQQPVGRLLRFAYGTIRINLELERCGDYAESIAHQTLKLTREDVTIPIDRYEEIASHSIQMLHEALAAYSAQDAEMARRATGGEATVDLLKRNLNRDLIQMFREEKIPFDALNALMMITRRFERVSDQAANICNEVVYMCTGEFAKHPYAEEFRVLFVDRHNAGSSQMAEALALALQQPGFHFASAGTDPLPLDSRVAAWMKKRGIDLSHAVPNAIPEVPGLERFSIVIVLDPEARKAFPPRTHNIIFIDWEVPDPARCGGSATEFDAVCESAFTFLLQQINDLVKAITTEEDEES